MFRINSVPEWNINPHLLVFMQHHPFLAGISRQVRKRCTRSITTAAVTYDVKTGEVVLWYNDLFMASLTNAMVHGVLKHEFFHIVFKHLTTRRRSPCQRWNVATDLAIDWLVWHEAKLEARVSSWDKLDPEQHPLPGFAKTPGMFPELFCPKTFRVRPLHGSEIAAQAIPLVKDEVHGLIADFDAPLDALVRRQPTAAERQAFRFASLIEAAPENETSEAYFDYLNTQLGTEPTEGESGSPGNGSDEPSGEGEGEESDAEGGGQPGKADSTGKQQSKANGDGGSMDDHRSWDDIPEELREKVENEVRGMVERAVREADSQSNGWGHTPADVCGMIRRSVSTSVDWKALLRHFIGTVSCGSTRRSITVRDRKYGLAQPGSTVGHTARLVIVIDQSGSVSTEMLEQFFAELEACTRKISITILPFDAECNVEDAWEWRKGVRPDLTRVKCGGTNFNAPTSVINEHGAKLGWEGAVFMTDGECFKPDPCNVKRAWILGPGCTVPPWLDDETAILMEEGMPAAGAWR